MSKLIHPAYFQIVRREGGVWYFRHGRVFYRGSDASVDVENREEQYGLTKKKIAIKLFRINAGATGYYLANLRDRQYYYCGLNLDDVKTVLRELGIGKDDPIAS